MSPRPRGPRPSLFLGFYGCNGKLVRVRQRAPRLDADASVPARRQKPPRAAIVRCPSCGHRHRVEILWREARDEELAAAEVTVS